MSHTPKHSSRVKIKEASVITPSAAARMAVAAGLVVSMGVVGTPSIAMADDAAPEGTAVRAASKNTSAEIEQAQEAVKQAEQKVSEAKQKVEDTNKALTDAKNAKVEADQAVADKQKAYDEAVKNNPVDTSKEQAALDAAKQNQSQAGQAQQAAQDNLDKANTDLKNKQDELQKAEDALNNGTTGNVTQDEVNKAEQNKNEAEANKNNAQTDYNKAEADKNTSSDALDKANTDVSQQQSAVNDAQKAYDDATAAKADADKKVEEAQKAYDDAVKGGASADEIAQAKADLQKAQSDLEGIKTKLSTAEADLTSAKEALKTAESAKKAAEDAKKTIDQQVSDKQSALTNAENDVKAKQDAYDKLANSGSTETTYKETSADFYQWLQKQSNISDSAKKNAEVAYKVISGQSTDVTIPSWYSQYVKLGDKDSATSLNNLLDTLNYLDKLNTFRKADGVKELGISFRMMAYGALNADHAHYKHSHSQNLNGDCGETLDWGVKGNDAFGAWWGEKSIFDNAVKNGKVDEDLRHEGLETMMGENYGLSQSAGHYLILTDSMAQSFGMGISSYPKSDEAPSSLNYAYAAEVSSQKADVTVAEFKALVNAYIKTLTPTSNGNTAELQAAKQALDEAKAKRDQLQTELNTLKADQSTKATALQQAQKAYDDANTDVTTKQSTVDDLTKQQNDLNTEITRLQGIIDNDNSATIQQALDTLNKAKQDQQTAADNVAKTKDTLDAAKEELTRLQGIASTAKATDDENAKKLTAAKQALDKAVKEYNDALSKYTDLKNDFDNQTASKEELQQKVTDLQNEIAGIQSNIESLTSAKDTADANKQAADKAVEEAQKALDEAASKQSPEVADALKKLNEAKDAQTKAEKALTDAQKAYDKAVADKKAADDNLTAAQKHLNDLLSGGNQGGGSTGGNNGNNGNNGGNNGGNGNGSNPVVPGQQQFSDVNDATPHHEAIEWMQEHGIATGWNEPDGTVTFRPTTKVVRQDYAAFLYRMAGSPAYTVNWADNPFQDVNGATPHYKEILWAAKNGYITGYAEKDGSKTFQGMAQIQRQDALQMLYRLAGSPKANETESFTDIDLTPFKDALNWAKQTGVAEGFANGDGSARFGVGSNIIRQDMAAFLQRAAAIINK